MGPVVSHGCLTTVQFVLSIMHSMNVTLCDSLSRKMKQCDSERMRGYTSAIRSKRKPHARVTKVTRVETEEEGKETFPVTVNWRYPEEKSGVPIIIRAIEWWFFHGPAEQSLPVTTIIRLRPRNGSEVLQRPRIRLNRLRRGRGQFSESF